MYAIITLKNISDFVCSKSLIVICVDMKNQGSNMLILLIRGAGSEEKCLKKLDTFVEDIEKSCNLILKALQEEYDLQHVIADISNIIKEGGFTYAEGFDRICLIIDRDRESFVSSPQNNQYQYVIDKCKEMGFGLYVTNPCFEFWLLLHFDGVFELDREKLLKNPKVTVKRRYVEQELRRLWPGI
ncbi:RloB family protein [Lachnospiraceae bacterium 48-33]